MFQESQSYSTMDKFILEKFPAAVKAKNNYLSFGDAKEELNVLKLGVGIRPVIGPVIIQFTGKDVLDFLHRVSTNSMLDLPAMHTRNTLFLNEKGRFIDRTCMLSLENEFMLIGSVDEEKRLLSWVNKYIIMEDIVTSDASDKYDLFEFIGAQTESFLTLIIGAEANSIAPNEIRKFYIDGFMFFLFTTVEKNNVKLHKILIEKEKTPAFLNYLFENSSVFDLSLIGEDAYTAFRVKNLIPAFPNEINDSTNPHEVDLINEVSFTKGCYIGQEVIARLETYDKVRRHLMMVGTSDIVTPPVGSLPVHTNTAEAGLLTSLACPELLDKQIGLALINKKSIESKEELYITAEEQKVSLKIF